jgi:hypothetical protein
MVVRKIRGKGREIHAGISVNETTRRFSQIQDVERLSCALTVCAQPPEIECPACVDQS